MLYQPCFCVREKERERLDGGNDLYQYYFFLLEYWQIIHVLCLVVDWKTRWNRGSYSDAKILFKFSSVQISVVKKPDSNDSKSAKLEVNKQWTRTNNTSPPGVASHGNKLATALSLCRNYDSEDDYCVC